VIEAMRVGARHAAMIVHSFSPADAWLEDYRAFARLMGVEGRKGRLERVPRHVGVELWMGWVGGSPSVPLGAEEAIDSLSLRFDAALSLASEIHRQHLRKGTTVPYVSHLLSVAALVLEDGGDEDEAIAALLHDALEDHPDRISAADIEAKFGSRVRDLVLACTDTPSDFVGGERPEWKTRKLAYLAHIRSGEVPWRVSLADKLHNARCILRDHRLVRDAIWERFTASKDETLWYYRSLAEAYRAAGADGFMIDELERVLAELEVRGGR
jgi:(p)ppGpp synthase/HD superfamily hydrolase